MTLATILLATFAALVGAIAGRDPVLLAIWAGAGCWVGWTLRDEREVVE